MYPKRLVDEEGFPLANVDVSFCHRIYALSVSVHFVVSMQVHLVRNLRHELAILQTDHKQVAYPATPRELFNLGPPALI